MLKKCISASVLISLLLILVGCSGNSGGGASPVSIEPQIPATTLTAVLQTNAQIAFNVYSDSLTTAQDLKVAIDALVANPNTVNLTAAKEAWLQAREPYGQTEAYRFRLGPIDSSNGIDEDGPESQINAWPLAEALIDYVAPVPTAPDVVDGIQKADTFPTINPPIGTDGVAGAIADKRKFKTINKTTIAGLNEADSDEANVATGYHAIEFLLWGQDFYNGSDVNIWSSKNGNDRRIGGGSRPATDYGTDVQSCTSGVNNVVGDVEICQRRGQYLQAAAELLIDDLQALVDAWDPAGTDNHYDDFVAAGTTSLSKILESMGRLGFGELAGERMNIALEQDSQEDEHSCFSDNTHRDIVLNALGIANSYFGTYQDTEDFNSSRELVAADGTGIDELLREIGLESEAIALETAINNVLTAVEVIDDKARGINAKTFDMQIAPGNDIGNADVRAAIDALVVQTNAIQAVMTALPITVSGLKQDTEESIE